MSKISRAVRGRVRRRTRGICEYCLSCPELTGNDGTLDHVIPEGKGIMMYLFGRKVFPADTHVGRLRDAWTFVFEAGSIL